MRTAFLSFGTLVLTVLTMLATTNSLTAQQLKYGDEIYLQNGWNRYSGGYLDTRGYQRDFEKTGNHLCVSTATSKTRDGGSGTWKVLSASGKPNGSPVLIGDAVHLQNGWNRYSGGYLDTRGYQRDFEKTGNHLCVSTATANNRDNGSGTWKILSAGGAATGTPVQNGFEIHLQNGWNRYGGGYLDTRGYQRDFEKTGNHLCVSTATSQNRDGGSGTWKVITTAAPTKNSLGVNETLPTEGMLVSANGNYMARMQSDGHLCVYERVNGQQGRFVWGSGAHGFSNGRLVMQSDGNLVVYTGDQAKWSSKTHPYHDAKFRDSSLKPVRLVMENDGKLKLYNSSNQVVWTS